MTGRSLCGLAVLAVIVVACGEAADTGKLIGVGQVPLSQGQGGGGNKLPTCTGASNCAAGPLVCTGEDDTVTLLPTTVSDYSTGLSSDGRGQYVQGTDGVEYSIVNVVAGLTLESPKNVKHPRTFKVSLDNPVPGGGGQALGTITDGNDVQLETQSTQVGSARQNLNSMTIGQTVTANQMNVTFHINGHFHILQMGPQAYGHCHSTPTAVSGTGTTTGTITRASATKWVVDLPVGSIGRLFDLYNTDQYAVDKGLYYFQMHYEIGQ